VSGIVSPHVLLEGNTIHAIPEVVIRRFAQEPIDIGSAERRTGVEASSIRETAEDTVVREALARPDMASNILEGTVADATFRELGLPGERRVGFHICGDRVGAGDAVTAEASEGVEDGGVGEGATVDSITGPVPVPEGQSEAVLSREKGGGLREGTTVSAAGEGILVKVAEVTMPRKELGLFIRR